MAAVIYNEDPFQKIKKINLPNVEQILVLAASFGSSPSGLGSPTSFSFQTPLGTFGPFGQFAVPAANIKPPPPAIVDPISKKMISSELAWTRGAPHIIGGSYFQTSFYNLAKFKKNPGSKKTSTANCVLTIPGTSGSTIKPAQNGFAVFAIGGTIDLNAPVPTGPNAPPGAFPGETLLQYLQHIPLNTVNFAFPQPPGLVQPYTSVNEPLWPANLASIWDSNSKAVAAGGGSSAFAQLIGFPYSPQTTVPNSLAWTFKFGTYDKRRTMFPLDSSQQPAWDTTTAISSVSVAKGIAIAAETHGLTITFPALTLKLS